jgi:predicted GIY-YIG superfamily endonuclease
MRDIFVMSNTPQLLELLYYCMLLYPSMLLFTMYVKDEYTAKKMETAVKKLSKKLKTNTEMKWQSVKDGNKLVIACDFYKDDDEQ